MGMCMSLNVKDENFPKPTHPPRDGDGGLPARTNHTPRTASERAGSRSGDDVEEGSRILTYKIIKLARRLVDVLCAMHGAEAGCLMISESFITDSKHAEPHWIKSWQALSDEHLPSSSVCVIFDPPHTKTALECGWLIIVPLEDGLGQIMLKGRTPLHDDCERNILRFVPHLEEEMRCAFESRVPQQAIVVVDSSTERWIILWTNSAWAELTGVVSGPFWEQFKTTEGTGSNLELKGRFRGSNIRFIIHFDMTMSHTSTIVGTVTRQRLVSHMFRRNIDVTHMNLGPTIGGGYIGTVYRVDEEQTGNVPALCVRVLEVQSKLVDKLSFCTTLMHRNVIKCHACQVRPRADKHGKQDTRELWIVMDLCQGGSLRSRLQAGTFNTDPLNVLQTARDIAEGVQYLHSRGVYHGDLHNGNILFDADDIPKICDVGMSMVVKDKELSTQSDTCITHLSPEQFGVGDDTLKNDQYAFGILLYEMAQGETAWSRARPAQIMMDKRKGVVPTPTAAHPDYANLIRECASFHHSDRPTWSDVLKALNAMISDHA